MRHDLHKSLCTCNSGDCSSSCWYWAQRHLRITGHKREETLKNYIAEPTKSERRNMSNILHKYGSKSAAVSLKPKQSTSTQQSPVPGPSSYDSESPVPSTSKGHLPVALCPDDDSDVDEPAAKVPRCDDVVSKYLAHKNFTLSSVEIISMAL